MPTTTDTITPPELGETPLTVSEYGEGRAVLLLHGGGGPRTVAPFAAQLARAGSVRVLVPVHPGFESTPRPEALADVGGLARLYVALLADRDLHDVIVVGNSMGGWIASEMATLGSSRVSGYVLVDAVGIDLPGHVVEDFYSLTPAQIAQRSYHDPERYGIDPATLPPEVQATMRSNMQTLAVYGGSMTDPTLAQRLGAATAPALVVWGEADLIADPAVGRAFADALPDASFALIEACGHLPQIEAPERLIELILGFAGDHPTS